MASRMLNVALCSVSWAAIIHAAPALAQEAANAEPVTNSADIVVTARRVEERLQDVPVAIAVVSQQQIANRNVTTAQDLAVSIPSLSATGVVGSVTSSFSLRGFGQSIGTDPSVGVYFADAVTLRGGSLSVTSGNGAGPGQFFDLQNLQVLKGPQGTLFGRNSTGGAILFVPQKPTADLGGYVEGSYGNYDMYRLQGVLNIPIGQNARFRIGVDHQKRDGYVRNLSGIGPKDFNDVNYTAARASLVVDLTPSLETYTTASYLRSNTNGDLLHIYTSNSADPGAGLNAALTSAMLARYGNAGDLRTTLNQQPTSFYRTEQWQVINKTSWRVSDELTIRNIAMYGELRNRATRGDFGVRWDLSDANAALRTNYAPGSTLLFSGTYTPPGYDIDAQSTFSDELRFEGTSFDGKLNWQAGGFFEYSSPLGPYGSLTPNALVNCTFTDLRCANPAPTGTSPAVAFPFLGFVGAATKYRTVGIYGQGTYKLTSQLSLTAGIRYNWAYSTNTSSNRRLTYPYSPTLTPTDPNPGIGLCVLGTTATNCTITTEAKSDEPTWTLGLEYKPIDDVLLYGKWSRGFRQGGIAQNSPASLRVFRPEKVDAYELGFKTSFRGAISGSFNVAAFYNKLRDQQLGVTFTQIGTSASPTTGVTNAGNSRVYGLEVDASISPVEGLSFDGSYAYLNSRIESIPTAPVFDANFALRAAPQPGDPLLFAPKHKLAVTGSYKLPLDNSMGSITLSATYTYTSRMAYSYSRRGPNNTPTVIGGVNGPLGSSSLSTPRNLVDASITWAKVAGSQFDLSVFGSNIFDKKYEIYDLDTGASGGFRGYQVGLPRLYGVRARYSF